MNRWENYLDPASLQVALSERAKGVQQPVDPQTSNNLSRVKQRAGWLDPQTQMALARSNASDAAIDAAGKLKAKQIVDVQAQDDPSLFGGIRKAITDNLKAVSRWGVASLNFVPEYTQGALAQLFDDNDDVEGWFVSTTLGSMIENPELRGEGYLPSAELMAKQAERARRYRGVLNKSDANPEGSAWTVGRAAANRVFLPNSKPYNLMSGFLDALVTLKADPTGPLVKTYKTLNKGRYMVPLLSKADIAAERLALEAEAGLSHGLLGATANGQKLDRFLRTNKRAVALVERLRDETSVLKIADDIFDGEISNDAALRLAAARTDDEVRGVLAEGWTFGGDTLNRDIRTYQKGFIKSGIGEVVDKIPLVDSIRKSRWFTLMPDNLIVVNGTEEDNRKAVVNIIRSLRGTGVKQETIDVLAPDLYEAFSATGTAATRKNVLDTYTMVLREQLLANGMHADDVDELMKRSRSTLDAIRQYMLDRFGNPTDNGMASHILNTNRDYLPAEEIEALLKQMPGGEIRLVGPLQLSEMLNRVFILPDQRTLRRLTANPFANKFMRGMSVAGKRAKRTFTVLPDENKARHQEITDRLAELSDEYPPGTMMPSEASEEAIKLAKERDALFKKVTRKVTTGEQRAAIELLDFWQNSLWKPLALATGGYVVRNSMDAQVRLAFGGLASVITHPWEYLMLVLGQSKRRDILGRKILGYETLEDYGRRLLKKERLEEMSGMSVDEFQETLRKELSFSIRNQGFDSPEAAESLRLTNVWATHSRLDPDGMALHTDGVAQTGGLIHGDPLQRIAAEGLVSGQTRARIIARIVGRIKNDKRLLQEVEDIYLANPKGAPTKNFANPRQTGYLQLGKRFSEMSEDELDLFLNQHVDRIVLQNVETQSGGMADLQFMQAFNYVPVTLGKMTAEAYQQLSAEADSLRQIIASTVAELPNANSATRIELEAAIVRYENELARINAQLASHNQRAGVSVITVREILDDGLLIQGDEVRIGSVVRIGDNQIGVVTQLEETPERLQYDPFTGKSEAIAAEDSVIVVPVYNTQAFSRFGRRTGSSEARRLIQQMPIYSETNRVVDGKNVVERVNGLPLKVKREILEEEADERFLQHSRAAMDKLTDIFFGTIYGSATRILDRSPAFRQYYYQTILDNADMLSPEEAQKVLDDLVKRAEAQDMSVEDFLGDNKVVKALKASTLTKGTATAAEIDEYAHVLAINQTKQLLFDASNRSNLEDVLRIIMPFAPAWREVLGTYVGFLKGNPVGTARSFQRLYSGALGADYDNDGRGFFYKDPITNQLMFQFPASGTLAKIFTGVEAPLEAPLKRLSQGIQAYPSLGPFMQVAASQLPESPKLNDVREFLLPYGEKNLGTAFNPTPQWIDKFVQAVKADTGKLDNVFGNTYIETVRALGASGDYDLNNPSDLLRLKQDAKDKARILTMLRAASQFLGPTAGATEFKIPTDQGDIFVSQLVKEFYDLQAQDYDSAVPTFLSRYGDEVTLYVGSKTRALVNGLEATEEFGQWQQQNTGLFDKYPDVAAYLAPSGSEFNFTVWDQQIRSGQRERLSDAEVVALAQRRVGSAKYAEARRLVGPYPSAANRDVLRRYRRYLHEQYPGFPEFAEFTVGEFQNDLSQLKDMLSDPDVGDNTTAETIRTYLRYRDEAVAMYVSRGGQPSGFQNAKSAQGLRDALASIGSVLSQRDTNFARVYDRLLAQEVEN